MADNAEEHDEGRRNKWFVTFVFNLIALVAFLVHVDGVAGQPRFVQWAASSISITFALSTLAVLAHLVAYEKFAGQTIEGGLAFLVLAFWAAVMPALMNPNNGLATAADGVIGNANLYFFSWFSLIASFLILAHFLRMKYKLGVGTKNVSFRALSWAGLVMTSFVVFVSASRVCQGASCTNSDATIDRRTKFAIAVGVVSAVFSLLWLFVGALVHPMIDGICGMLLLVFWIFGIIFITFGDPFTAPGAEVGNLYFFTWASFVLSMYVTGDSLGHMMDRWNKGEEEGEAPESTEKEAAAEEDKDAANV